MTPSHGARLMALALGVGAILALPTAASAAVTPSINAGTKTITLTGDGTGEVLTVSETGGNLAFALAGQPASVDFDPATAGDQTAPADSTFSVVVDMAGGDDQVTFTTSNVAATTVAGGDGNDLLGGTDKVDTVSGGAGNDRIVPGKGNDTMNGGDGNDVLVWNNGDNNDVINGDAGNDETEVNGAAVAGDVFTIAPNAARVRFDRTNLVPFTLDMSVEKLTANGLGGGDTMTGAAGLAPLVTLVLNGGVGADTLTGGDGNDIITGGDENDTLAGSGGDDRIVGDRGDDTMNGGDGDDLLVWNNGDNTDIHNGEGGFDTVEVNGATGAGDQFVTKPAGDRVRFDRTNLVPFGIDIGTTERLALNTLGGDDTITDQDGLGSLLVRIDGGAGNDTITGGNGTEDIAGGSGNDTITPGGGNDTADGQAGDDAITANDGVGDHIRCGVGNDRATADAARIDQVLADCEAITRPAPAAMQVTTKSTRRLNVRGLRLVRLAVVCPATADGFCDGTVSVQLGRRTQRAAFTLVAGRTAPISVPMPVVPRGRVFTATATVKARDLQGDLGTATARVRVAR